MRLEQPDDLYKGVPSCWWSRPRWVATMMALYDLLYDELRATLRAPSVKRETFLAWAIAESDCADLNTGRECRPSVEHLRRRIGRNRRTVQRCRELAGLMDGRQVVFVGRHRTLEERVGPGKSWRRGDKSHGWTSEAALIESPSYAHLVDPAVIEQMLEQGFVAPLPRSGGKLFLSRGQKIASHQNVRERRAPRGPDKKERRKTQRAYDERAQLLASRIKADERFPGWVRRMSRDGLSGVLTKRAIAGWTVDDVYLALNNVLIAGKRIFNHADDPHRYLSWCLKHTPIDEPPALLDRAREVAEDEVRRAEQRAAWEEQRAKAIATANSPGRAAAVAHAAEAKRRAIGKAAEHRQEGEAARRELARQVRE
ncbi:hypothetical protein AB0L82_43080 [Nocardia sp. NPDC052001]|uniref:hypothetical protein n=1 Tax=Nocardia sp. NPDC052001 TaxID=3154853 RepID=UPI00341A6078